MGNKIWCGSEHQRADLPTRNRDTKHERENRRGLHSRAGSVLGMQERNPRKANRAWRGFLRGTRSRTKTRAQGTDRRLMVQDQTEKQIHGEISGKSSTTQLQENQHETQDHWQDPIGRRNRDRAVREGENQPGKENSAQMQAR
jgi:hypothetical protein